MQDWHGQGCATSERERQLQEDTRLGMQISMRAYKDCRSSQSMARHDAGAPAVETVEGDEADEDDAAEEDALAAAASPKPAPAKAPRKEPAVQLLDPPKQAAGLTTHRSGAFSFLCSSQGHWHGIASPCKGLEACDCV